jgi:hypothetical protein
VTVEGRHALDPLPAGGRCLPSARSGVIFLLREHPSKKENNIGLKTTFQYIMVDPRGPLTVIRMAIIIHWNAKSGRCPNKKQSGPKPKAVLPP